MNDALHKKIESLPEDVQKQLMEIPDHLLIRGLRTPELFMLNARLWKLIKDQIGQVELKMLEKDVWPNSVGKVPTIGAFQGQMIIKSDFDDPIPGFEEYM